MMILGKPYRIKSRFRFTVFVVIAAILLITILNATLGFSDASSLTQPEYLEIQVGYGDTLWQIAGEYMADYADIRKSVHILCSINEISAGELKAGQTLLVPIKI